MILKLGSKGDEVKLLQEFLGIVADGDFGPMTEMEVKNWQRKNGLTPDGVVGPVTLNAMGIISTDNTEALLTTPGGMIIRQDYLPSDEYFRMNGKPEYLFIHHTAGWENPYNVIRDWGRDTRGNIATEFVIGGQSIKGNNDKYDGEIVQAFPDGNYGWHLGTGNSYMHRNSVGIEVCNFGYLTEGGYYKWDRVNKKNVWIEKTKGKFYNYVGVEAAESQIVKLKEPFRGHQHWHRYSDESLCALKENILYIAERDGIDICEGLPKWVSNVGAKAFDYSESAKRGDIKGLFSHTNVRKDKFDMFPQQELLDMLVSL
jgi:hypothetical protein